MGHTVLIAKSQMNMIKDQRVENVHHDSRDWLTPQQISQQNNKHIHSYYVIFIIFFFYIFSCACQVRGLPATYFTMGWNIILKASNGRSLTISNVILL